MKKGRHKGYHHSKETKEKISNSRKKLMKFPEFRYRCGNAFRGKHLSKETKEKLSIANTGNKNPNYGKHHTINTRLFLKKINTGENNHFYGKHHTKKVRKYLSSIQKGKHNSPLTEFKIMDNTDKIEKRLAQTFANRHIAYSDKCQFPNCNNTHHLHHHHPNYKYPEIVIDFCLKHHTVCHIKNYKFNLKTKGEKTK